MLRNNLGPIRYADCGSDAEGFAIQAYKVGPPGSWPAESDQKRNLEEVASTLNLQAARIESLGEELSEAKKLIKSLSEDLTQFSAFEQICNSGLLRNLKVDGESDFAQTLLGLLQSTLELQVSHLKARKNVPTVRKPTADTGEQHQG